MPARRPSSGGVRTTDLHSRRGTIALLLLASLLLASAPLALSGHAQLSSRNTPGRALPLSPPTTLPGGIIHYVPMAITNNGISATGADFDEMVKVNSSAYSQYEAVNLQNVEFFYGNGSVIPSWLESGNSVNSKDTIYWLKLDEGILPGRILYAYIGFANAGTDLFNGKTVGEAPELSQTYGQYDNGKMIFPFYDNFASGSSNSAWSNNLSPSGSFSRNNGLTVHFWPMSYFVTSQTFGPGTAFDAFVTSFGDTDNIGYINTAQAAGFTPGVGEGSVGWAGAFIRSACINIYPDQWNGSVPEANVCGGPYGSFYSGTVSVAGIYSVDVISTTSSVQSINYSQGPTRQPVDTYYPNYPASVGFMNQGNSIGVQWVRVRNAAPGGSMPTVIIGNFSSTPPLVQNTIWVSPARVNYDQFNGSVGSEFNVTVWAHVESGNHAWQVEMTFDPSLIRAVAAGYTGGASSRFYAGYTTDSQPPVLNNKAGSVLVHESLAGSENGSAIGGSLFWVEFRIASTPSGNEPLVDAISTNNSNTYFVNSEEDAITTSKLGCTYTFSPLPFKSPVNAPVEYTNQNYPVSIYRQYYTSLTSMRAFTVDVPAGPMAISVGIMNGTAAFEVTQNGTTLLSERIAGPPFDYIVVTGSTSYGYVNFNSTGKPLYVVAADASGMPDIGFNVYNNYISKFTASLITYPPQFGAPVWASPTPVNTGMSVVFAAPKYSLPTPLSIQGNLGYCGPNGQQWYTQIGFNNWANNFNVSYAGWGISSNIFGSYGSTDLNMPLIPGDMYNFTMALVSGTTWEWVVNGTFINEGGALTGLFNTTTTYANCGANYGMETLPWWGGSVNITNLIRTPVMLSFRVNGTWTKPSAMTFTGIGENWNNGNATWAPGTTLWGIAGHLQDPSVPDDSLLFNDSLPIMLSIPGPGEEPVYGNLSFPQVTTGGGLVTANRISDTSIEVSPIQGPTLVSLVLYGVSLQNLTSARSALVSVPELFQIPNGTTKVVVYAENTSLNETSSTVIDMTAPTTVTSTTSTASAPTTSTTTLTTHTSSTTPESTTSPTTTMSPTTTSTTSTSSTTSSGGIPEFPVQLGFALLVTVVIVASYVVTRRIILPRTGSKSSTSGA